MVNLILEQSNGSTDGRERSVERIEAVCGAGFLTSSKGSGSTSSPASLTKSEQMKLKAKYNRLIKDWRVLPPDADITETENLVAELNAILIKLGDVGGEEIRNGFGK